MTRAFAITPAHVTEAKWAFTTRRVDRVQAAFLLDDVSGAQSGDLVLGRVDTIGSHKKLQLSTGRPSALYLGDHVVLACGARYAPDQFEGIAELRANGSDMLASGGVIGRMRHRNARMSAPTRIVPLGLLGTSPDTALNTRDFAIDADVARVELNPGELTVIAVSGASMNSGKTTAAASLVHGLVRAGHRVAAIKATGTGAYGDYNAYLDAGAHYVADFVDTGLVSTYLEPLSRIYRDFQILLGHAVQADCDIAVVELADGVYQRETAALLRLDVMQQCLSGIVFAAPDAVAAAGGAEVLGKLGLTPAAITGMMTRSTLASAEAAEATGLPIVTREDLLDPAKATALLRRIVAQKTSRANQLAG